MSDAVDEDKGPDEEKAAADWFLDDDGEEQDASFKDYEITASPNDFNINTIVNFIDSGAVKIPAFQRNYVWDLKRASKLIESILIGLPIPQIFLYEEARNSFLVIDGQQRLMSIYYFVKQRFPRRAQRPALRRIFAEQGRIPAEVFEDDRFYMRFNLSLPGPTAAQHSRFHKKNFSTLGDYQTTFGLRTIRNVVIKQTLPEEDGDTSVFEIFNRLNTGGVNLRAQEIRSSIYRSDFLNMLEKLNLNATWRRLLNLPAPDLHSKDVEILLRSAATLLGGEYHEPMSKFLNVFAKRARTMKGDKIGYLFDLFSAFFAAAGNLPDDAFSAKGTRRFNIASFEAVFRASCVDALAAANTNVWPLDAAKLNALKDDQAFIDATRYGTGRATYVTTRFERARELLRP